MAISLQRYSDLLSAADRYRTRYERLRNAVVRANAERPGDQVLWTLMTYFADHQEGGRENEFKDLATIMSEVAHHKATHKANVRRQRWRLAKAGYPMPSAGPLPYHQLDPSALIVPENTVPLGAAASMVTPRAEPLPLVSAPPAPPPAPEYELAPPPAPRAPPPAPKLPVGPDGFVDNSRLSAGTRAYGTAAPVRSGFVERAAPAPEPHPDAEAMAAMEAKTKAEELQAMQYNAQVLSPGAPQGPVPKLSALDE